MVDPEGIGARDAVLGRVYTVTKVNRVNVKCSADDGGRGLIYPPDLLLPYDPENPPTGSVTRVPIESEWYVLGEIVTFKKPPAGFADDCPFVVMADNGDKVRVARLGGDKNKYFRATKRGIVRRDVPWLIERLMEEM